MLHLARLIRIRGVVQGVGFRPFAYRLARRCEITGWVRNGTEGVVIHAEGSAAQLDAFLEALETQAPTAARITSTDVRAVALEKFSSFEIRASEDASERRPTVRISPDLATCEPCLRELFDSHDRRHRYPYINCTDCGPRFSIVTALPYDRPNTTMAAWPMCADCRREYADPFDRRYHAQPIACPACGPQYVYVRANADTAAFCTAATAQIRAYAAIEAAAADLRAGAIVGFKGIGGYLLACDAANGTAVAALRERKYRKERPFALMVRDLATARNLVELDAATEALLVSVARPIVLARARTAYPGVAPGNRELGIMLPYAPLHHLLFAAGAPDAVVATSANRSNEPIAFEDDDARASLHGIADALLVGERPIARRADDSVVRADAGAQHVLRFARGYAPANVARLPASRPILALGADLKNAIALSIDGNVVHSGHIGDLEHRSAREACERAIASLCAAYEIDLRDALVVCDAHPEYVSSAIALELSLAPMTVQHHRAHIASVIAERGAWDTEIVGFAFDGTGYGDDGTIWGGEMFAGSVAGGLTRVAHLRPASLPGGDAAARFPVQAAAGYLYGIDGLPDLSAEPFAFGTRYSDAQRLVARGVRAFPTTSMGRLFDTVAALLGFTRGVTFEAQAALWLEQVAAAAPAARAYQLPLRNGIFDQHALLRAVAWDRADGADPGEIARGVHRALAAAIAAAAADYPRRPVVCSGGVFANGLLCAETRALIGERLWLNNVVPANDGGICLGQVALAAIATLG